MAYHENKSLPMLACLRCSATWRLHSLDKIPKYCARCHSSLWNIPYRRTKNGDGEKFIIEAIKTNTDQCIEWPYGKLFSGGYGSISTNKCKSGRAHVVAWCLANRKKNVPSGIEVRHTCDNPPCINPRHLVLGTHQDNMTDAALRRRMEHGENRHNAKLNENAIKEIRASNLSLSQLAKIYRVGAVTIHWVRRGVTWKHVT